MPDTYKPITVLVVDDEKLIRELLGDTLGALGYQTITAESCARAREVLAAGDVDVVITDERVIRTE